MSEPKYDLVAIGNAMVDILKPVSEDFIARQDAAHGMKKGSMTLIDERRAEELTTYMEDAVIVSGGSAGNTMAGFASFGGKGAFIGKVAQDVLGDLYRKDMQDMGVVMDVAPLESGAATGRCLVMVTPDGERTMNTFLGAGVFLNEGDIDADLVSSARVTYMEGYLYDPDSAKAAFKKAAKIAHDAGHLVSIGLSDPFCVDRHRADFKDLVENHIDILFANEDEITSLYEVGRFEDALAIVRNQCKIAVLTRSAKGSVIVAEDNVIEVAGIQTEVVDTTGAGDQYAAGFLYGFTQGMDLAVCGRLGTLAATEVIGHMGPRPEIHYADLVKKAKAA